MFRLATEEDIERIATLYEQIHDAEDAGKGVVGWERNVYPTQQTAEDGIARGDLFVEECNGIIVATGIINQEQVDVYKDCNWQYKASDDEVMVLHTLVVDTRTKGKGFGSAFVEFYEEYARAKKCSALRIDTQEQNAPARAFYKKHGFREAGVVLCIFNGIPNVRLVCIEKKLKP